MADQIEVPGVPRGFRNAPSDIKERAAALVRDFGSNPALLEGAIVAALETERLASSPDQVKRETIEAGPRIYIDCEFNGWMGELISFAMVAEDGGEFYSVLPEPRTWDKWCYENVFPVLNKTPCASAADFRVAFLAFLRGYRNPTIIADWPADLYYFNKVLLGSGHEDSVLIPCRMELVNCDYSSAVPHNALEDARAIATAIRSLNQGK